MVEELGEGEAGEVVAQDRGRGHAHVAHDPEPHAAPLERAQACVDAVGRVLLGVDAGAGEGVEQRVAYFGRNVEAQILEDAFGRVDGPELAVGLPTLDVGRPRRVEDGVEALALTREAGLLEDARPRVEPASPQVPALLVDERVPEVERHRLDGHRPARLATPQNL